MLAKIEGGQVILAKEKAMKKQWIKAGLPAIATKLAAFLDEQQKHTLKRKLKFIAAQDYNSIG